MRKKFSWGKFRHQTDNEVFPANLSPDEVPSPPHTHAVDISVGMGYKWWLGSVPQEQQYRILDVCAPQPKLRRAHSQANQGRLVVWAAAQYGSSGLA